jgi:hypothetical protein
MTPHEQPRTQRLLALLATCLALACPAQTHAQSYGIAQEQWNGLSTNDFAYPDGASFTNIAPTSAKVVTSFTTGNSGNGYGQRLRAFILPPLSGNYTFAIASDEWSQLYLSTDETPDNRVRIAYVDGATAQRDYRAQTNQTSAPVALEAGRRYYIEALHREALGLDYLDVQWQLADDTIESPINSRPGNGRAERLIPFRTNTIVAPAFLRNPSNLVVTAGRPASLSLLVSNQSPVSYQWQENGVNLPGANSSVLKFPSVTEASQAGKKYRCLVTTSAASLPSAEAQFTILPDSVAPTVLSVASIGLNGFLLTFSEAIQPGEASTVGNFTVEGTTIQSAELGSDPTQVRLNTSPLTLGRTYTIEIRNLKDLAGLVLAANTRVSLTVEPFYGSTVGTTNSLGTISAAGNGFDLQAGGREIAGKSDQFLYKWTLLPGDFDIQLRVESLSLSDLLARGGLMAREDLSSTSRFAAVFATPSLNGLLFQSRTQPSRDTTQSGNLQVNFPNTWLRLRRVGDDFSGYGSLDGTTWKQLGSATIGMPEFLFVGMAASSRSTNATTTARFRDYTDATGKPLTPPGPLSIEPPGPSSRRGGLVISEIMYHPQDRADGKSLEFVEIFNSQPFFEDMSGYKLSGDITFEFAPNTIIPAGGILVVAKAPADLESIQGISGVLGPYTGTLPNNFGQVRLWNEIGGIIQEVNYQGQMPWPVSADGAGHSLVLARPSYGENELRAWSASDQVGGSPGRFDGVGPEPLRGVVINEWLANPDQGQPDFIELYNHTSQAVDLSGAWLTDSPNTNKFKIPANTSIPAHGFVSFATAQFQFGLSSFGETIYLVNPSATRVIDAVAFEGSAKGVSQGRFPDGSKFISELKARTPGAANSAELQRDLVVNEIMYAPITGDNDDEFIELYNRGNTAISLAGWKLAQAATFTFPTNASIPAKGYVVLGRNLARLVANYPNLNFGNTYGNYDGSLGNGGDRIQLLMPEPVIDTDNTGKSVTNMAFVVVNDLSYRDGGRWGKWSDGGGSSLELIDSHSDNRQPANWADSDETTKAPWTPIEFTGRADLGGMENPDRLQLFLQNPGEALIDDIEVFTATNPTNLLANPKFETNFSGWTPQGTHEQTTLETTEGYQSKQSMHIRASARGDNGGNRIRANLARAVAANSITTIRAKVRWLAGTPHILLRLRGNYLECAGIMTLPKNLGTPGAANSRTISNAGPAIFEVSHSPILPLANQNIVVTAHASDPDELGSLTLKWRNDTTSSQGSYQEVPLVDDGTQGDAIPGDGTYAATIPGQANNTMVAFYITATDGANPAAASQFPNDAPKRECLFRIGETQPSSALGSYRLWVTKATLSRWSTRGRQSNHPLDCSFAYNDFRVIYNAETLYSGSPWHTPAYNGGPAGEPPTDYVLHAPADDLLLGTEDFVFGTVGNQDNDPSKLAEQTSYWIARKMGIPYNYRRFFFMYFNGQRRASSVYEDTQQPSGEVIDQYFPDDASGPLHKIEDWFEFDDAGDTKTGNVDATLDQFLTLEGKKVARYRVCWRPRSIGAGDNPNDFSELFKVVDALSAATPEPYNTALQDIVDVEQWLSVFAMQHIVGNWDSYGYNRGKNMYTYKPTRGKWGLLLWDIDFDLGSGGDPATTDLFATNEPTIQRLYANPLFRRMYLRICQEAAEGPLRADLLAPLIDAKSKGLADNGVTVSSPQFIKDYARDRRNYILNQVLPKTNFVVYGPNLITTNVNFLTLTGAAPVNVDSIAVNGTKQRLTWTTIGSRPIYWSTQVPLAPGANALTIQALDRFGNVVSNGTQTIQVTLEGENASPDGNVIINEISYSPADPGAGYIEIYNRSTTAAFDLSGWRLDGVDFDFPAGTLIGPGRFWVVAKDQFAFGTKFAFRVPVLGEFNGNLDPEGETLSLLRPGASPDAPIVVDQVHYEATAPWLQKPATEGVSLNLVDASQDNSRVSNWADDGDGWRFVSVTARAGGPDLFVYLTGAGNAYLDDLSIVEGDQAGQGQNLVTNGGFEAPLAGTWRVANNHLTSTLVTDIVKSGASSLRIVSTNAGSASTNGAIFQRGLPIVSNNVYTLSYWLRYGDRGSNLVVKTSPGNFLASTQSVRRALGTPGAPNVSIASLPSYDDVWLNEVGPYNATGPTDAQGDRDPWVELHNTGSTPVSLKDYFLSDSYSNLKAWAFPSDGVLQPGEFKVIWVDGDADQSTASQWHTSFRVQPTQGSIALSRLVNGEPQIVDYLNYDGIQADEAYGSYPDGQPFFRQVLSFPTAGAPNNGASKTLVVRINEWMASNTGFILDPADVPPAADDWFELYNPGRVEADLSGYYLTDRIANKTQFEIPAGTRIPAGGYLLVWADGSTDQNSTNSTDLHTNFQLSRAGEELGLFAPDGTAVDTIQFGSQTNNVSQGRIPDGGPSIVAFEQPTPRAANRLSGANTPPVLTGVGNRILDERTRFSWQLTAQDAEEGSSQLVFSLAPGAPAGATITPAGLFVWRPTEDQGPGKFAVTFRVNDNGTPSLQSVETITVTVREVNQPPTFGDSRPRYVKVGELVSFSTATDGDRPAQALGFRLGPGAPASATLDPTTGVVNWRPTEADAGKAFTLQITATDNGTPNLFATAGYQINVYATQTTVIVVRPSVASGQLTLSWESIAGQSYQPEFKDSLSGEWKPLGAAITASGVAAQASDTVHPDGLRFYRVRQL